MFLSDDTLCIFTSLDKAEDDIPDEPSSILVGDKKAAASSPRVGILDDGGRMSGCRLDGTKSS